MSSGSAHGKAGARRAPGRLGVAWRGWSRARKATSSLVILGTWEAMAHSGWVSPLLLPTIEGVLQEAARMAGNLSLFVHVGHSVFRALVGFLLATVVGVIIGFLMGRFRAAELALERFFAVTYPVPKISIYPILVFIFGLGNISKIALIFLECVYPMVINTYYGTRAVNPLLYWAARNMGAGPGVIFRRVVIPAAAPHIFAGIRIALPIALVLVVITEMIGSNNGLGYLIIYSSASFRSRDMFVGILGIGVVGFIFDNLLVWARRRLIFWERETRFVA